MKKMLRLIVLALLITSIVLGSTTTGLAADAAPLLLVSAYSTDPVEPALGEPFVLTLRVANAGRRDVRGVLVTVEPVSADPAALTTVGTGNLKRLPLIPAGASREVTFRMVGDPRHESGVVPLAVSVTAGNRPGQTQRIGLQLRRRVILEIGQPSCPATVKVGTPFTVAAEVLNAGAHAVSGVSLAVRSEGAKVKGADYLVGVLESGDVESVEQRVVATSAGPLEVSIVAAYRDDFGRAVTESRTIEVEAVKPTARTSGEGGGEIHGASVGLWSRVSAFFRALVS